MEMISDYNKGRYKQWIILDRLSDVILSNVKGCVVEIGMGRSTYILAHHAKKFKRKMYACDSSKTKGNRVKEAIGYKNLIFWHGKSLRFIEQFDDEPALVFLDGNHYYHTVSKEAKFFLDKLAPGGVMFLHDTYLHPKHFKKYESKGKAKRYDTYKIRQELENTMDAWCLTFPYTAGNCGLTMVLKKETGRPYYRI
jgi:predicted O-methyltransferase YrrM